MAKSAGSSKVKYIIIFLLFIVAITVVGFTLIVQGVNNSVDNTNQSTLANIDTQTYNLVGDATTAASSGDKEISTAAIKSLPRYGNNLTALATEFSANASELDPSTIATIDEKISSINLSIAAITDQSENVTFLFEQAEALEENIPKIQQAYTNVVDTMLRTNVPPDQVAEAQAQVWRAERLLTSLNRIFAGSSNAIDEADQFRQDALVFTEILIGMKQGNILLGISRVESPEARAILDTIEQDFGAVGESIQSFVEASPALGILKESSSDIQTISGELLAANRVASDQIANLNNTSKRPFSIYATLAAAAAALLLLAYAGISVYRGTRNNLSRTEETNEKNQEAILRLLDEIADLGEGDLTVTATVTEDFTGAIADSINYAIEQLRELVSKVVTTAEAVSTSSNETRATTLRLSEASEHQATQIAQVSNMVNNISEDLTRVSGDASKLADVATSSVEVAQNGASVVQNTIDGMDTIREQIQDTSKRIKRLGESSQEIGDIVSLINEIADQTNILALNASIQAAMAGEAGRGFAVVADEVQGLAERATSSTKQIESLVKTIQTDTNEAVASMEQTTAEVVRGAQLANDAGSALSEIQSTSENLATLILAISQETQKQSDSANEVAGSMRVIQDITSQTLEGTTESAHEIGELTEQAQALYESVADFKLPDSSPQTSIDLDSDEESEESSATSSAMAGLAASMAAADALSAESDDLLDIDKDILDEDFTENLGDIETDLEASEVSDFDADVEKTVMMHADDLNDLNQLAMAETVEVDMSSDEAIDSSGLEESADENDDSDELINSDDLDIDFFSEEDITTDSEPEPVELTDVVSEPTEDNNEFTLEDEFTLELDDEEPLLSDVKNSDDDNDDFSFSDDDFLNFDLDDDDESKK